MADTSVAAAAALFVILLAQTRFDLIGPLLVQNLADVRGAQSLATSRRVTRR